MKTCTKCKAEKPFSEFHKHSARPDGLQPFCKICKAKNHSDNREQISAQRAKHYSANRKEVLAKQAAYQAANKEKVAEYQLKYRSANAEKYAQNNRNRRARKRNAEGRHTAADIARIFENQRGLCANCHAKLFNSGRQKFHVDHVVPLIKGGSNWPDNLQCLCPQCNNKKRAKDPIEWAQQNGRLI